MIQAPMRRDIGKHGGPEIMNTDQGSQFTSEAFAGLIKDNYIKISIDGNGSWRDNVFAGRLCRSVKYEELELHAYDSVTEARLELDRYFNFYIGRRPRSSLDEMTAD
jgi:putative transposase